MIDTKRARAQLWAAADSLRIAASVAQIAPGFAKDTIARVAQDLDALAVDLGPDPAPPKIRRRPFLAFRRMLDRFRMGGVQRPTSALTIDPPRKDAGSTEYPPQAPRLWT